MAGKRLVECSFLIPIRQDKTVSNGAFHSRKDWNWLNSQLFEFGGATRAIELYEGWYLDPDTRKRVKDLSRKYIVALPRNRLRRLRALLREACQVFEQKCIYLSVAGDVEFVERPRDETG